MRVIGRRADDRVQIRPVKQPAEITVGPRPRKFFGGGAQVDIVHIAQRDDVFAGDAAQVGATAIGDTHNADVELFVG